MVDKRDDLHDETNGWSVFSNFLKMAGFASDTRHQENLERTTNAEIGALARRLPGILASLGSSNEAHELIDRLKDMVNDYLDTRTLNQPAAAARAEGPLNKSIAELLELSVWLRATVQHQGKGHTINVFPLRQMAIQPLSQRVPPASLVAALDHSRNAVMIVSKLAAQALEEVTEQHHPLRQATRTVKRVALPINTDQQIAIVLPDRAYTSADDHVRYMQKRLWDLAAKVESHAQSFAADAGKSRGGSNPQAVARVALDVLEYSACLIMTCDRLSAIASEPTPHPTTSHR